MHNVLIVDEEEHLLSALEQNLFPERDDITILTASDGETGLEHLKNSRIDLLISDIKMPGKIDGFQLILRAKEVAPDARVIIITAFGSNRVQNFADRIGITHYIEKPFNTSELRDAVLEILDEKEGFQGVLSDLELTDIIQMLCLARRTALLHLKHRDHRGRIIFDNGDVVHAVFDDLVGEDAVFRMLALRQGDIFMQGDFDNDQRTIDIGWQDLLFEGVRRADEERAELSEASDSDDAEDEDDSATTDTGMGLAQSDVEQIIEEAVAGSDPESSFFSDDELREIEAAAVEGEDLSDSGALPFAMLAEGSEPSGEFRSPFQRERSALSNALPRSGELTEARPRVDLGTDDLPFEVVQERLEAFSTSCPGLRHTAILSAEDGVSVCAVAVSDGFDDKSFAALTADIQRSAQLAIDALAEDRFVELHVTVADAHVILRPVAGTPYHHVAVVDRHVSLGVGLVMMRRLAQDLLNSREDV